MQDEREGVLNLCRGRRTKDVDIIRLRKNSGEKLPVEEKEIQPVLLWPPLLSLKTSVILFNVMYTYSAVHFPQIYPFQKHSLQLLKD